MSFYPFKSAQLEFKINISATGPSCYYVMAHEWEAPGYSYNILLIQHSPGASLFCNSQPELGKWAKFYRSVWKSRQTRFCKDEKF